MIVSWTLVLGTTFWSFARILQSQAKREATPDPTDDMTIDQRVPPSGV